MKIPRRVWNINPPRPPSSISSPIPTSWEGSPPFLQRAVQRTWEQHRETEAGLSSGPPAPTVPSVLAGPVQGLRVFFCGELSCGRMRGLLGPFPHISVAVVEFANICIRQLNSWGRGGKKCPSHRVFGIQTSNPHRLLGTPPASDTLCLSPSLPFPLSPDLWTALLCAAPARSHSQAACCPQRRKFFHVLPVAKATTSLGSKTLISLSLASVFWLRFFPAVTSSDHKEKNSDLCLVLKII